MENQDRAVVVCVCVCQCAGVKWLTWYLNVKLICVLLTSLASSFLVAVLLLRCSLRRRSCNRRRCQWGMAVLSTACDRDTMGGVIAVRGLSVPQAVLCAGDSVCLRQIGRPLLWPGVGRSPSWWGRSQKVSLPGSPLLESKRGLPPVPKGHHTLTIN